MKKAIIEFTPSVIKYGRNNKDFNWRNTIIKIYEERMLFPTFSSVSPEYRKFWNLIRVYGYSKKLLKELEKMKIDIEDGRPNVNGIIVSKYPTKDTPLFPKLNLSDKSSLVPLENKARDLE